MKFFRAAAIFFLFLLSITSFAQQEAPLSSNGKNDTIPVGSARVGDEIIPYIPLPSVTVTGYRSAADIARYNRLKRNVLKVLPYARFARERYHKLQMDLAVTSDRRMQKKLVKECDKEIKDMFYSKIKQLEISQGDILIKLLDREIGYTSYDLVRQLKDGITAFSLQLVARVVGHNLKDTYDPKENQDIEAIIRESGFDSYKNTTR